MVIRRTPKRKKKRKTILDQRGGVLALGDTPESIRQWSVAKVATAWQVHGKVSKKSPLEMLEVSPTSSWFAPCPPSTRVVDVLRERNAAASTPKSASVLVVCMSVERTFEVIDALGSILPTKPVALAAHGGGRKRDQLARQGKALEGGLSVAVGTPSRITRLLDERSFEQEGVELMILDLQHDRKQFDLLTHPDARRDCFALLRYFCPLLSKGSLRLTFCSYCVQEEPESKNVQAARKALKSGSKRKRQDVVVEAVEKAVMGGLKRRAAQMSVRRKRVKKRHDDVQ